jgi:hypothetical protein
MGFLETLKKVLGGGPEDKAAGHAYDCSQWRKKLTRVLDELPASQEEWEPLMAEARSLKIDPDWVKGSLREEFALMMRRAVADGVLTGMEHRKLDLARDLIGIPDAEAEATLHAIVAEASTFFDRSVDGA